MPGLITPLRESQQLNMEREDKKRSRSLGKDFICRLQCMFSHTSSIEKLTPEETLLWSQSLEKLLQSKYGMATFHAFLKSEYSDENIEFWLRCEEYKKIKSSYRMNSKAKKIYEQYIQAQAPKEINIDHQTREIIKRNVKSPTTLCFDEAQKIVFGLMERDSYPRFLRSEIYRTLLESAASDSLSG
ncbi:regulator of G-protein signaling 13-like [Megalops cyprinoides]|uniref:regulator of G-protein signaling 13-like n=1 Tax=Megalops cyprinoides TaxID=118141 RepID=UPI00186511D9|nr:regulator of G-protein signaling 13-like [Megalops cyprinoides]